MLVLHRSVGESIHIGDDVIVTLVKSGPNGASIGIDAPRDVLILRKELLSQEQLDEHYDNLEARHEG